LRQRVVVTGNLSDDRRDLLVEREIAVLDQKSSDPAEIDGWEEVLKVEVKNPAAVAVLPGVGDDRLAALESVRGPILKISGLLDFVLAVLEKIGQPSLEVLQLVGGCLDGPLPRLSASGSRTWCTYWPTKSCRECTRRPLA
jgi:hypothetical protein